MASIVISVLLLGATYLLMDETGARASMLRQLARLDWRWLAAAVAAGLANNAVASLRFMVIIRDAAGVRLPAQTNARLEQSPIAKALRRDDSPGWGMVGFSPDPVIKAMLSNTQTGNVYGTFYYRVTLRDVSSKILVTSNKV